MDVILYILLTLAGTFLGSILAVLALSIFLPICASVGILVNRPDGLNKSGIHFFTRIAPGQVKIIDQDGKLVRMIMDTGGKKFARVGKPYQAEYWKVITQEGEKEEPTNDIWLPIRWWARIVYKMTGAVFIGIYPFVRIREYTLERTDIKRDEDKKPDSKGSNLVLNVKTDLSDHFRVNEFLFPMHITAAETADKIGLDIIGVAEMEVVNPYKAAYGTDRWDQKVINLVTDALVAKTKGMKLDEALTAVKMEDVRAIQSAVEAITDDSKTCGIEIKSFRILEINPVLDAEGLKAIQAEAIALQRAKATVIDGEARAKSLTAINKANEAGGEAAIATMHAEALVRAAEAASKNGGSVILTSPGSNGNSDATLTAILVELQKQNKKIAGD